MHTTLSALTAPSEGEIGNQIPEWITNAPPTPEGEVPYIPTLDQETGESYEKPSLPDNIYYDYEEDC